MLISSMPAAAFQQHIQAVGKCQRHALEHRADQVRRRRLVREAEEHAARVRIIVRRALAGQIGQEVRRLAAQAARLRRFDQLRQVGRTQQLRDPVEGARGRQQHRHLVPAAGNGMAEGMRGALGIGAEPVGHGEQHAGSAQRQERLAGRDDAHAHRAGRIVAAAAGHEHAVHAQLLGDLRPSAAGYGSCLPPAAACWRATVRWPRAWHRTSRAGPHPASRCRRHPTCRSTRSPVSFSRRIILGQQHRGGAREQLRLMARHPQQLRRGESGHHDVAGDGARRAARAVPAPGIRRRSGRHSTEWPDAAADPRRSSSVAPCIWPDRPIAAHARRAPRPAGAAPTRRGAATSHAASCSENSGCGPRHGQRRAGLGDDRLALIHDDGLDAGGAEVDSQIHVRPAPTENLTLISSRSPGASRATSPAVPIKRTGRGRLRLEAEEIGARRACRHAATRHRSR